MFFFLTEVRILKPLIFILNHFSKPKPIIYTIEQFEQLLSDITNTKNNS